MSSAIPFKAPRLVVAVVVIMVAVLFLFTEVKKNKMLMEGRTYFDENSKKGSKGVVEREMEIQFWEQEIKALREGELQNAINELTKSGIALESAKKRGGFFPNAEARKAINVLDEEYKSRLHALANVRKEEESMLVNLKPLYGVLSLPFAQDQKEQISKSITYVKDVTYQSALWDSLFDLGNAENFSDIIIGFFVRWVTSFIIVYPFAILHYALWALPWSVYAYSSGIASFIPGVVVYVLSMCVISLPFVALVGGLYLVAKYQKEHTHLHRD